MDIVRKLSKEEPGRPYSTSSPRHMGEETVQGGELGSILGLEDPLEEGIANHSSILAWRIPMDRGAWQAAVCEVAKSRKRLND